MICVGGLWGGAFSGSRFGACGWDDGVQSDAGYQGEGHGCKVSGLPIGKREIPRVDVARNAIGVADIAASVSVLAIPDCRRTSRIFKVRMDRGEGVRELPTLDRRNKGRRQH